MKAKPDFVVIGAGHLADLKKRIPHRKAINLNRILTYSVLPVFMPIRAAYKLYKAAKRVTRLQRRK